MNAKNKKFKIIEVERIKKKNSKDELKIVLKVLKEDNTLFIECPKNKRVFESASVLKRGDNVLIDYTTRAVENKGKKYNNLIAKKIIRL